MADAKLNTAAMVKLLEAARDLHERQGAILDELDAHLGGKATIAAQLKAFELAFDDVWCLRYAKGRTGVYVWNYREDRPHSKRLLGKIGLDELITRAARYLRSDDDFYRRGKHPFSLFVRSVNEWATPAPAAPGGDFDLDAGAVPDCKHDPRCATDQQHTKRKASEMRS